MKPYKARQKTLQSSRNINEEWQSKMKVHGGYSTGPKTAEGKARSANNIIKYNEQRVNNNRANNEQDLQ